MASLIPLSVCAFWTLLANILYFVMISKLVYRGYDISNLTKGWYWTRHKYFIIIIRQYREEFSHDRRAMLIYYLQKVSVYMMIIFFVLTVVVFLKNTQVELDGVTQQN
jgi:hypothetical protein